MPLTPHHASLVELARQLRELGASSFETEGMSVQFGRPAEPAQPAQHIHVARQATRKPTEDETRAKIESERLRELSRV